MSFETLWKNWVIFRGDLPQRVAGDWKPRVLGLKLQQSEIAKMKVFEALLAAADAHQSVDHLVLCYKPTGLRPDRDMKRGELWFAPCVPTPSSLSASRGASALDLDFQVGGWEDGSEVVNVFMTKPSQPIKAFNEWKDTDVVVPFFWVTPTSDEGEANMICKPYVQGDVTITIMTNKKQVPRMTPLRYFQAKTSAIPLDGVKEVEAVKQSASAGAATQSGQPTAAPKKASAKANAEQAPAAKKAKVR